MTNAAGVCLADSIKTVIVQVQGLDFGVAHTALQLKLQDPPVSDFEVRVAGTLLLHQIGKLMAAQTNVAIHCRGRSQGSKRASRRRLAG